jgi:dTDP-3-amino-3,4,6-trideoxy-alpha-D-glucose transaminase
MGNSASFAAASPVKLNDFQRQWKDIGPAVLDAVNVVGESGWYILGAEVTAFERDLASFWGRSHAVGMASGLDAIELALRALGCKPGDKVLVPPVSAFATALAVIKLGAVPVFIDCDSFGLADLALAEKALAEDDSLRYFVPVHLYGHCLDMKHLAALRKRFSVQIVEDCAQSIGASNSGQNCGTAGDCAATSFYPTKNLGALGDGGALLTDSTQLDQVARCLRDYGQSAKYTHSEVGYNSRLDELHAAVLRRALLPRLSAWNQTRQRIAREYLRQITCPHLTLPGAPAGSDSCWHLFPVLAPAGRKRDFMMHLHKQGVSAAEHYPMTLMDQPAMQASRHEQLGDCAKARDWCAREVSLPIHPYLLDEEVQRVIQACNSWR